jgi:adenylate cyclase
MALDKPTRRPKNFNSGLGRKLSLSLGLMGIVLAALPIMGDLEQRFGLQWLFSLRGARVAPPDVVVLAINSETTDALNLPEKPAQWPRTLHTQAVNNLARAGAAAIVFDLFFEESRAEDAELGAAFAQANNVVLSKKLVAQSEAQQTATSLLQRSALLNAPFVLPREPLRVDGYWTFKSDDGELASMPVAALQVFARSALPRLRELVIGLEPALAADLQASNSKDMEQTAAALRKLFRDRPALRQRALQRIDGAKEWPAREKQILRSLVMTYGSDSARFLNFYGPPRSVTTLPYFHVMGKNSKIDAAMFKDKAVFIGYLPTQWRDYEAIRDDYHTVYSQPDGLRLSGVEIAATAFANLLDGADLKPLAVPRQMALFGLWGALAGALAGVLSMRRAAIVIALASLAYLIWARQVFAGDYVWLPLIAPLVILSPVAFIAATLFKYRHAKRQREQIINLAKQFVPANVLNRSLADAAPAGPETQLAYGVCLATDVKNYTRLSETMAPQALANLMNEYFSLLNNLIEQHGGAIADLRGDALLALWARTDSRVMQSTNSIATPIGLNSKPASVYTPAKSPSARSARAAATWSFVPSATSSTPRAASKV